MGREVRRVPPTWQHPVDNKGRYIPLMGGSYSERADKWLAECVLWQAGKHPDQQDDDTAKYRYYWDWDGGPPEQKDYRPEWSAEEATAYQVYETVSEGTPISPVFVTKEALITWLVTDGDGMDDGGGRRRLNREAAERFVKSAWAPSFVSAPGIGVADGVAIHEDAWRAARSGAKDD